MWAEFEWENKVAVNTDILDLNEYLSHVLAITNMKCMTPQYAGSGAGAAGSAAFLAANLYARSMFGEDALLNLSVEKVSKPLSGAAAAAAAAANGSDPSAPPPMVTKVGGYIRIRSKTQGIALSLGDKIQAKQRGTKA